MIRDPEAPAEVNRRQILDLPFYAVTTAYEVQQR